MNDLIVAVDGGGSKTEVVALTPAGELIAHLRGPGSSPHLEGLAAAATTVDGLVRAAAGSSSVAQANLYISGLDLPAEVAAYAAAVAKLPWADAGTVVDNDLFALLRAGTDEPDAIAVVCGTGVNAVGVRADGAQVRFPALGAVSGDWGGGLGLGYEMLWHAARDIDGRGPGTGLTGALPTVLGVESVQFLIEELHFGRFEASKLARAVPALFDLARSGDAVAVQLIERQADEIVAFARAALTRLDLRDEPVPVVLGGGVIRSGDERLLTRIARGLAEVAPAARIVVFDDAPIVGAALLALGDTGAGTAVLEQVRTTVLASRAQVLGA